MRSDPIAHEARTHRQVDDAITGALEGERLQPALERRIAELAAQLAAHTRPLRIDRIGHVGSGHRLLLHPGQSRGLPAIDMAAVTLGVGRAFEPAADVVTMLES